MQASTSPLSKRASSLAADSVVASKGDALAPLTPEMAAAERKLMNPKTMIPTMFRPALAASFVDDSFEAATAPTPTPETQQTRAVPATATPPVPAAGRVAAMASKVREQLSQFTDEFARTDAAIVASQKECERVHHEHRRANEEFTDGVVRMVREQRCIVEQTKTRAETGRAVLAQVNEKNQALERDVEKLVEEKRALEADGETAREAMEAAVQDFRSKESRAKEEKDALAKAAEDAKAAVVLASRDKVALTQEISAARAEKSMLAEELRAKTAEIAALTDRAETARTENRSLSAAVAKTAESLAAKDAELTASAEEKTTLAREIAARDAQITQTEAEVQALHAEVDRLTELLAATEKKREELAKTHVELIAHARELEKTRDEADAHIEKLISANEALENEITQGEAAVMELHASTAESFEYLRKDRELLIDRNAALAAQMEESQMRLVAVRAEAESIIKEEQERNEDLERKHEETIKAMREAGGGGLGPGGGASVALDAAAAAAAAASASASAAKLDAIDKTLADFERTRREAAEQAEENARAGNGSGNGLGGGLDDSLSTIGFSDIASNVSEIPDVADLENHPAARAHRAQKAAANKVKFDNMKSQRNKYKAELRAAQKECERMKAEMAAVDELKKQVLALREATYV